MNDIGFEQSVLVTGATGGIGSATVRALADHGYTAFAAVRGEAAGLTHMDGVHVVTMDVTDPEAVRAAAERVEHETHGRGLRAVVNNAGLIVQGPLELVPPEDLHRQFAVNALGPAYVTQSFLPLLRAGRGRVINVTAPTARVPAPLLAPIGASKAALNELTSSLRIELAAWRIPVSLIEPGTTTTGIFARAEAATQAALDAAGPDRARLYADHIAAVEKATAGLRSRPPEDVARVIVAAVAARRPKRRYVAGSGVRAFGFLSRLPAGLQEAAITRAMGLGGIVAPS